MDSMNKEKKVSFEDNLQLVLAEKYIRQTNKNIFLTGKAGTGKTTFLKHLCETISKRFVVLAPTGVAALQAGGVTIHSFFQLPLHIYIPKTIPQTRRFSKAKINLIRSIDLIIIDEISMVRCDILDEVDCLLRRFRYNERNKPFGGVQLLMIGDLSQLPPIYNESELEMVSKYYPNFYFFNSLALKQSNYITISLQHIYRQKDEKFINILNAVRDGWVTQTIVDELNARYVPKILEANNENYIVLCSHNYQADKINDSRLDALDTEEKSYKAEITGDFSESCTPNSQELRLKVDSQVMFLKNDYSKTEEKRIKTESGVEVQHYETRRYYNGKIGVVKELGADYVVVRCPGDEEDILVERYVWEDVRYTLDKETNAIKQEVIGTFSQFPLRLAWAVTIHKSQGLTFDNVIIMSNRAFSHGQVYVALSRCRSLEGIYLTEKFDCKSVIFDSAITSFNNEQSKNPPTEVTLHEAEDKFLIDNLISIFDFTILFDEIQKIEKINNESISKVFPVRSKKIFDFINTYKIEIRDVAAKYIVWLQDKERENNPNNRVVEACVNRSIRAKGYFLEHIQKVNDLIFEILGIELDNEDIDTELKDALLLASVEKETKYRLLESIDSNFNSLSFLSVKNNIVVQGTNLPLSSITGDNETDTLSTDRDTRSLSTIGKKLKSATKDSQVTDEDDIKDMQLFEILRSWRKEEAKEKKIPAYCIISQKGLVALTNYKPKTEKEFVKLKGLGKKTFDNYGEKILEIIQQYTENNE